MNAQLVLKDFNGVPEITPDAFELKKAALQSASLVARVETAEQQTNAIAALREVKAVLSGMEQTRKAVKAPVLALGKKIDSLAHGFIGELEKQYGRLQGLINHYQRKQLEAKREEEKEIEREQETAADLRRRAHQCRLKGDVSASQELEAQAFNLEMNAEVAVVHVAEKPKGLVVRNKINFQVIDPIVFCQAYPQFWRWHQDTETLKLDRMRILDELNRPDQAGLFHKSRFPEELSKTDDTRLVQPAGLRVFEETKAHVR
jgi:hypothetical protein